MTANSYFVSMVDSVHGYLALVKETYHLAAVEYEGAVIGRLVRKEHSELGCRWQSKGV